MYRRAGLLTVHPHIGVIYGSTIAIGENSTARLADAVNKLASLTSKDPRPSVIWSMSYVQSGTPVFADNSRPFAQNESGHVMTFPPASLDLAFEDSLIDSVKAVWRRIMGSESEDINFMQFPDHEGMGDDEDYQVST